MKLKYLLLVLTLWICGMHASEHSMEKNTVPFFELLDRPVVINLERHAHRFEETKKNMEEAGFTNIQRFDAIDGYNMPQEFFDALNIVGGRKGQKGCAASHLTIWKQFYESDDPREYLFIAEDDMLPHSQFYELFQKYWMETPADFDIILVGNGLGDKIDKKRPTKSLLVSIPSYSLLGYIISKKGAEKLYNMYMEIPARAVGRNPTPFVIDVFLKDSMAANKITYYCFDGRQFPDEENRTKGLISHRSCTGICFQHRHLGTTLQGVKVVNVP
jgi:GR25 family glycosyltransferase involved in LPS biosynthesis